MENTKTKIFTKSEVAQFLNITPRGLRAWTEKRIQTELLFKCCFEVLKVEKIGRKILYTCTYKEVTKSNKRVIWETFRVKDVEQFINYSKDMIENIEAEEILTKEELCKKSGTNPRTATNHNDKLLKHGVLSKDGYLYVCIEKATNKKSLADEIAFKNFWHHNLLVGNEISRYNKRYIRGELSLIDHTYVTQHLLSSTKGEYIYYKVSNYIVQYDNELTELIINS